MKDEMIIRTPAEWKKKAILDLDESMQHLMKSRKTLVDHNLLLMEHENLFRTAGETLYQLLMEFQKK